MANQSDIDDASVKIANLVDKAQQELIKSLTTLVNMKVNPFTGLKTIRKFADDVPAFVEFVMTYDVEGTLKKKLINATSVYANAHRKVLESTIGFAKIDPKSLSAFATLNEQLFDNSIIRTISGHIRTQLVSGVQAGLSADAIISKVAASSISNAQMQTLVNTTLNTYSRTITNQMMSVAPQNTKYVYIGPVDEKTRPECLQMASAGRLTLNQIVSRFGQEVLVDGGGFNCRHKWEIASSEGVELFEGDKVNA